MKKQMSLEQILHSVDVIKYCNCEERVSDTQTK